MTEMLLIPFPRSLYDDIVRFSDGRLDPVLIASNRVESWVENSVDPIVGDPEVWGDRIEEVVARYAPDQAVHWETLRRESGVTPTAPLIWKQIVVPHGSDVRMEYKGALHFAKVANGKIVDDGKGFSPNQWASKVADDTSRDAWRDIWFREPHSSQWVAAYVLRERVRESRRGGGD